MAKSSGKGNNKKKSSNKKKEWNLSNGHHSFWMKFYAEQCGYVPASDPVFADMVQVLTDCLTAFKCSLPGDASMDAYIHTDDMVEVNGSPFEVASEKPHAHLYVHFTERKRFSTFLNDLKSCNIDLMCNPEATKLLKHVVEEGKGFPNEQRVGQGESYCVVYNCHADNTSKNIKGKVEYPWNDPRHITTYTEEQFNEFVRLQNLTNIPSFPKEVSQGEKLNALKEARELGFRGGDFDEWYFNELPPVFRTTRFRSQLHDEYGYGLDNFLADSHNTNMTRLCIYLQGPRNVGKTYAVSYALEQLGYKVYSVSDGGGTGKMDDYHYWHDALVLDDASLDSLLDFADDKIYRCYRRGSRNNLFAAKVLAVTSNISFEDYYKRTHHINTDGDAWDPKHDEEYQALCSRFIRVSVGADGHIVGPIAQELRGTPERQNEKLELFNSLLPLIISSMYEYYKKKSLQSTGPTVEERLSELKESCNSLF